MSTFKTRLDTVVRLREREEEKAERALWEANARAQDASKRAELLAEQARREERAPADASEWELIEQAHVRTRELAAQAHAMANQLQQVAQGAKSAHARAHKSTEIVRRVAESRREELIAEARRAERRELDDIANMLFSRR